MISSKRLTSAIAAVLILVGGGLSVKGSTNALASQVPQTAFNGKIYQSHQGLDNKIYTRFSSDGTNWSLWYENGGLTPSAPALAVLNGRLYQSHRGMDNKIYTRSSTDGVNWTPWVEKGGETLSAPALAVLNDRLYQSHRGMDNKIYTRSSTDGANWTQWLERGGETLSAPALAVLNGKLYQSHRGMDNKIYTRSSTDGANWTQWVEKGGETLSATALAVLNGKLYQSHRGMDNKIYTRSSTDGVNWTQWVERGGETPSAPALAVFNGILYQTHQGLDNKIYTRSSSNGVDWSQWVYTGGETPTESDDLIGQINLPFNRGQTWYVCQGYNGTISHQNNFAFDLTVARDFGRNNSCWAADGNVNKSAGQAVLAPSAGTVWHVGQDLVCLEIDSRRSLLIGHIDRRVGNGQRVSQDAILGTLSSANSINGGYAHIHIEARQSPRCTPGTSVPFTATNGFQFKGIGDLPGSVTNTHWKRELRRS